MTTVSSNPPVCRISVRAAKKVSATKKASHKSIFGLLSDWKIDTQASGTKCENNTPFNPADY